MPKSFWDHVLNIKDFFNRNAPWNKASENIMHEKYNLTGNGNPPDKVKKEVPNLYFSGYDGNIARDASDYINNQSVQNRVQRVSDAIEKRNLKL